jgi:transcriptional/translational regulatory protein YebC/TACO1
VSWDFTRAGAIEATPPGGDVDAEAAAIEAGAQDLEAADDGQTRFITEPTELDAVGRALGAAGWTINSQALVYIAKNPVSLDADARAEVEAFLEALDEDDDVQTLFVGLA